MCTNLGFGPVAGVFSVSLESIFSLFLALFSLRNRTISSALESQDRGASFCFSDEFEAKLSLILVQIDFNLSSN